MDIKHVLAGLACIGWLWYFFGNPWFLALLAIPIFGAFILSLWKKLKVHDLVEPLVFAFLCSAALTALLGFAYRLAFDAGFLGLVVKFPLFSILPIFLLAAAFFAAYGFVALRELGKSGAMAKVSANAFYVSMIAAAVVAYAAFWVLSTFGLVGNGY